MKIVIENSFGGIVRYNDEVDYKIILFCYLNTFFCHYLRSGYFFFVKTPCSRKQAITSQSLKNPSLKSPFQNPGYFTGLLKAVFYYVRFSRTGGAGFES